MQKALPLTSWGWAATGSCTPDTDASSQCWSCGSPECTLPGTPGSSEAHSLPVAHWLTWWRLCCLTEYTDLKKDRHLVDLCVCHLLQVFMWIGVLEDVMWHALNRPNITLYKVKFWYSAVPNPQDCSKRFTLYFPDRPVQSNTVWTSLGIIQPCCT